MVKASDLKRASKHGKAQHELPAPPAPKEQTHLFNLRLPLAYRDALQERAAAEKVSMHTLILRLLYEGLKRR